MKKNVKGYLGLIATAVLLILCAFAFKETPLQNEDILKRPFKYYGEYGLCVKKTDTIVEVRWFTKKADSAFIEVEYANKIVSKKKLAPGKMHFSTFEFSANGKYTLKYGSLNDKTDQHQTVLNLNNHIPRAAYDLQNIDSVYVIGDTHGEYENLESLLVNNHLMDKDHHWTGGTNNLVFMGDLFDRGDDVTKVLWMIYQLEMEAKEAGGDIHIVLGNHEIMTFTNDLRYISPKENSIAATYGIGYQEMYDIKESILGEWLATKPSVLRIDHLLFTHGGFITSYGDFSLQTFNDSAYKFMQEPIFKHLRKEVADSTTRNLIRKRMGFFYSPHSPYWYRGYLESDTTQKELEFVLSKFNASIHIVGHTTGKTMKEYHFGKLISTDVHNHGSEILLLVKKKRKRYDRFKYDVEGDLLRF